jgi:hypothetical protein
MPNDKKRRTIPVRRGSAGPAKAVEPARRTAIEEEQPTKRTLDERQARIRPTRRAPPLPEEDDRRRGSFRPIADVPPTECDEPEEED